MTGGLLRVANALAGLFFVVSFQFEKSVIGAIDVRIGCYILQCVPDQIQTISARVLFAVAAIGCVLSFRRLGRAHKTARISLDRQTDTFHFK